MGGLLKDKTDLIIATVHITPQSEHTESNCGDSVYHNSQLMVMQIMPSNSCCQYQYIKILTCVCLCVCVCVTEVGCSWGGTRL